MTQIILNIVFSLVALMPASDMRAFHAGFFHKTLENGNADSVSGEIYIAFPNRTYIQISEPIEQIMVLKSDEMMIYYPESNKGFDYLNVSPLSTSWLLALGKGTIDDILEDYKLEKIESNRYGDTSISLWQLRGNKNKPKLKIKVFEYDNRLQKLVLIKDKDTLATNYYKNYIEIAKNFYFPTKIESIANSKDGQFREIIRFDSPEALIRPPAEIIDFHFPPDAKVKKYE